LTAWARDSKKNTVDAITGATLKKHVPHNVVWDCRDAKGKLVPDGTYHIRAEFSEVNGRGPVMPLQHVKFQKGAKAISITPKNTPNFVKIKLDYTPEKATKPAPKKKTK
jgi:flagellar hook assembly protein FlgD